jgi:dTDP-4-dehydrorhamnose reductase
MKKILLIGNQGQLGQELQPLLEPLGKVVAVGRKEMDLTQRNLIVKLIEENQPDLIINAAAYTAVDKAETETEIAMAVNGEAPTIMAQSAEKIGATLLHVSTDYVFDGSKNTPYTEEDVTNPISAYGKSKLAGEEGIQTTKADYYILRTAWVYGTYGKGNFVKTMLRLGKEREELGIVSDQVGTPTWTKDIALAITKLSRLSLENGEKPATGIYHFTNSGVASWYDLAIAIFEEGKKLGFPLKIRRVAPITTAEYPTPAKRPAYSVLSNRKLNKILGTYPPYWRDSLRQMLEQLFKEQ